MLKILPVVALPSTFKLYTPAFSSKSMMVELKSPLSNSEDGGVAQCLYTDLDRLQKYYLPFPGVQGPGSLLMPRTGYNSLG